MYAFLFPCLNSQHRSSQSIAKGLASPNQKVFIPCLASSARNVGAFDSKGKMEQMLEESRNSCAISQSSVQLAFCLFLCVRLCRALPSAKKQQNEWAQLTELVSCVPDAQRMAFPHPLLSLNLVLAWHDSVNELVVKSKPRQNLCSFYQPNSILLVNWQTKYYMTEIPFYCTENGVLKCSSLCGFSWIIYSH